jgi:hypothetical protein
MSEETEPEEFHPFVALLLARMESNPREFVGLTTGQTPAKSNVRIVEQATQYLTSEEKKAVKLGMRTANLNLLHEVLMGAILKDRGQP